MEFFVISFAMLFGQDATLVSDVYMWNGRTLTFKTRQECENLLLELAEEKRQQGNEVVIKKTDDGLTFTRVGGDLMTDVRSYYECSRIVLKGLK